MRVVGDNEICLIFSLFVGFRCTFDIASCIAFKYECFYYSYLAIPFVEKMAKRD